MPFDLSGNFSRDFNWQQDRDNGIRILASRMDGECDNFAQAFNVTFLRTGIVPMSGNLAMGQNYLTGLGAGNAAALSVRYADDPTSGFYLNGIGKPSMVAGGTTRIEANTTGVKVFGTFDSSGTITQNGVAVATTTTLANYASLSGATFIGAVSFLNNITNFGPTTPISGAGANLRLHNDTGTTQWTAGILGTAGAVNFSLFNNVAAVEVFRLAPSGALTIQGSLTTPASIVTGGTSTVSGNQVWHAGNLSNPASLNGATFTGQIVSTVSEGLRLANAAPFLSFYNAAQSTRFGYLSHSGTGGNITLANEQGGNVFLNTGGVNVLSTGPSGVSITGSLSATGALTQNGQQVWHAGNFDPTLKANLASPALTGTPTINGNEVGTRDVPQSVLSAAFSFIANYRGGHVYYNGAAAAATIQPNSTTAMPIGAAIAVVNDGSGVLTLTRGAGVALVFNNVNSDHALAVGGMATLLKVGTDRWFVSGVGLT